MIDSTTIGTVSAVIAAIVMAAGLVEVIVRTVRLRKETATYAVEAAPLEEAVAPLPIRRAFRAPSVEQEKSEVAINVHDAYVEARVALPAKMPLLRLADPDERGEDSFQPSLWDVRWSSFQSESDRRLYQHVQNVEPEGFGFGKMSSWDHKKPELVEVSQAVGVKVGSTIKIDVGDQIEYRVLDPEDSLTLTEDAEIKLTYEHPEAFRRRARPAV